MKFLLDVNMPPQLATSLAKIGREARALPMATPAPMYLPYDSFFEGWIRVSFS
jgi:hypothetical protein